MGLNNDMTISSKSSSCLLNLGVRIPTEGPDKVVRVPRVYLGGVGRGIQFDMVMKGDNDVGWITVMSLREGFTKHSHAEIPGLAINFKKHSHFPSSVL